MMINVPFDIDDDVFSELNAIWVSSDDCWLDLPNFESSNQLEMFTAFFINKQSCDFQDAVLNSVVEHDLCSMRILKIVFKQGEVGNRVSICLRNDLDEELTSMCEFCDLEEVQDHMSK